MRMSFLHRSLAAALFLAAATAHAAPLDNIVPGDALLYIGWQGADALAPQYAGSNLEGFLKASTLPAFFSTTLPQILARRSGNADAATLQFQIVKTLLTPYWKHPAALYIAPIDFDKNPTDPAFRMALFCDAGPDAKRLVAALTNIVESTPAGPHKPSLASNDSLVVLAFGMDAAPLLQSSAPIAKNPQFAKAPAPQPSAPASPPALAAYADVRAAIANIDHGLKNDPTVPPNLPPQFHAILDTLGLSSVTQCGYTATFTSKAWTQETFIGIDGPRTGLLRLAAPDPFNPAVLAAIPQKAVDAMITTLDLHTLYTDLRTALPRIDPAAPAAFDRALQQFHDATTLDLDKDLLAPMGNLLVVYRAPLIDGISQPPVLLLQLKDRATFAATLRTLEARIQGLLPPQITLEKTSTAAGQVTQIHLPQGTIAYALSQDAFLVSTDEGLVPALQFGQAAPAKTDLSTNPTFAALRKPFPEKLSSLAYADAAELYPEFQQSLLALIPAARLLANIDLPDDLFPTPQQAAPFLSPSFSASWIDSAGAHSLSRSAFPGAEFLGTRKGSQVVAVTAMGTAILLPSLARARELSNRAADAASARALAQLCVIYGAEHDDHFPNDLSTFLADGSALPRSFVTKRAGTPPLQLSEDQIKDMKAGDLAKQLADHCDFVYLGKNMSNDADTSLVLVYEKPSAKTTEGINVAFHDAHAEFLRWDLLADRFKPTNDFLKAHHLPEIDTDALIKQAGATLPAKNTPQPAAR